tara:strand:+ start:3110 stop:3229 length:120 start_codon:yes stop_codon:yes gene_type:complete
MEFSLFWGSLVITLFDEIQGICLFDKIGFISDHGWVILK